MNRNFDENSFDNFNEFSSNLFCFKNHQDNTRKNTKKKISKKMFQNSFFGVSIQNYANSQLFQTQNLLRSNFAKPVVPSIVSKVLMAKLQLKGQILRSTFGRNFL